MTEGPTPRDPREEPPRAPVGGPEPPVEQPPATPPPADNPPGSPPGSHDAPRWDSPGTPPPPPPPQGGGTWDPGAAPPPPPPPQGGHGWDQPGGYGQQPPGGYQQPGGYGQQPPGGYGQYPGQPAGSGLAENVASGLSYVLTWLTGLIFFLIDKRPEVRFHAMQSIAYGVIWTLVGVVGPRLPGPLDLLFSLVWVAFLIGWVVLLVQGFQGKHFKLPVIGDFAEQQANQPRLGPPATTTKEQRS
jgi:uncharacterized membrane protein